MTSQSLLSLVLKMTAAHVALVVMLALEQTVPLLAVPVVLQWVATWRRLTAATSQLKPLVLMLINPPFSASAR
jgi:hypothetical protein